MFNVSLRIVNKTEDAEDVLQESFVSAFKHINQYSGEASFGAWLKRIVINKSIDVVRQRKPDLIPVEDWNLTEDMEAEPFWEEAPYSVADLRAGIQNLPDGYRLILCLYLFEDYTHKMIAEKLKITEGTSKSQYARAKNKLRELLQQTIQGS